MKTLTTLTALSAVLGCATGAFCSPEPLSLPFKPDPPLTIDGNLDDWNAVPGKMNLDTRQNATVSSASWKSPQDLSASVQLAWRQETLYFGARVTDDILRQTQRGASLWKGDHLELYVDAAPETDQGNNVFGPRQFQIGLSPGNFSRTGNALADIAPEAYFLRPAGITAKDIQIAAQRTPDGYTIEAAIPWTLLGFSPQAGLPLTVEVGVSDTDGVEATQEKMLTIGTAAWQRARNRLLSVVLANADGSAPASITSTPLFESRRIERNEAQTVTFDAPAVPPGYETVLSLQARLEWPKAAGYTQALEVTLNGQTFNVKRLTNKAASEERVNGKSLISAAGNSFTVPAAPNYDAIDQSTAYALKNGKAALLEFRVTDLLKASGNTLVLKNAARAGTERTHKSLAIGNAKLLYRIPDAPKVKQGPPGGPLPMLAPRVAQAVPYSIQQNAGESNFAVQIGGKTFQVTSEYSTPAGKWEKTSNAFFTAKRQIEKKDEWIVVRDTLTNLTRENLPVMHRKQVQIKSDKVWLGGLSPSGVVGTSSNPHNPTVFGAQGEIGFGLLPLDDVFQVHVTNYSTPDAIGLADNNLVLQPGSSYTAEWAIVPVASADSFDFINATRRLLDVNFQFDGSFAFLRADPDKVGKWSDRQIVDFARYKDAKYLSLHGYAKYKGLFPHGTALQQLDLTTEMGAIARRRRLLPDVKQLAYFHAYIDVADEAPEKYKDSRSLMADGTQGDYGQSARKLFVPTLANSYGQAIVKNIDIILDDMKLDGVYWDEMDRSRYSYSYSEPWDGVSADIDPQTMKVTRLKSSVTLLSQPWCLAQAKRIMERGLLIANGGLPSTRTMRDLHYTSFNETGSISNCVNAQLFTPIALGDHLTERSAEDAYRVMLRALDYGCLYYWYNDLMVVSTHHTLTQYMFPFTPLELHQGYVIGKERIITNRSGIFGWSDNSQHEVHLFDYKGREVDVNDIKPPAVAKTNTVKGQTWTELRIGEGWSAAIVRR